MKRSGVGMKYLIPAIIGLFAFIGLADSFYLALVHYDIVSPLTIENSGACQLAARSCADVIVSQNSTFFGIPHAILGMGYFGLLLGAVLVRFIIGRWFAPFEMLGFLIFGLAFSAYLAQELLLRMHVPCSFCPTAHALNVVIIALYTVSLQ